MGLDTGAPEMSIDMNANMLGLVTKLNLEGMGFEYAGVPINIGTLGQGLLMMGNMLVVR